MARHPRPELYVKSKPASRPMPRPTPGGGPKRPSLKKKIVGRSLIGKGIAMAKSHAKAHVKKIVKHAGKKAIGSLKKAARTQRDSDSDYA